MQDARSHQTPSTQRVAIWRCHGQTLAFVQSPRYASSSNACRRTRTTPSRRAIPANKATWGPTYAMPSTPIALHALCTALPVHPKRLPTRRLDARAPPPVARREPPAVRAMEHPRLARGAPLPGGACGRPHACGLDGAVRGVRMHMGNLVFHAGGFLQERSCSGVQRIDLRFGVAWGVVVPCKSKGLHDALDVSHWRSSFFTRCKAY